MGFFTVVLGMLVGGYGLGIWTASRVLHERQGAYEDGSPEQPFLLPIPETAWSVELTR
jgi:hypothetical protein